MYVRQYNLTVKNKAAIVLVVAGLVATGVILFAVGMTLLVALLGVGIIAGGALALRSAVNRALGRRPAPRMRRLDPDQEVFPVTEVRTRAPRIAGRDDSA